MPVWRAFTGSPEAVRFLGLDPNDPTTCEGWFERQAGRRTADGSGLHAVTDKVTGELLGQCGLLTQTIDDVPELEVGYHFLPSAWGQGYATEAARAVMRFAFDHALAPSLISLIHVDNLRSAAVARRNGLIPERRIVFKGLPVLVFRAMPFVAARES